MRQSLVLSPFGSRGDPPQLHYFPTFGGFQMLSFTAKRIAFLASKAASFMTGTVVVNTP